MAGLQTLPTTRPTFEFEQLKSILEVYCLVFNTRARTQPLPILTRISAFPPASSRSEKPTIYKLCKASRELNSYTHAIGLSSVERSSCNLADFDLETALRLRRAYLKFSQCDFALQSMIKPIRDKMKEIGATVEWLLVEPCAKFILQPEDYLGPTLHSVFRITSSTGLHYVADFTIEQFGHEPGDWFTTQAEYMKRFTKDGEWNLAPPSHQLNDDQTEMELKELLKVELMCWDLDWKDLEGMDREERLEFVEEMAFDAFGSDWDIDREGDIGGEVEADGYIEG